MNSNLSPEAKKHIKEEVRAIMDVFTAKSFKAQVNIAGNTDTGNFFTYAFVIDATNEEFKKFLNDWGARRSAQLL